MSHLVRHPVRAMLHAGRAARVTSAWQRRHAYVMPT
jgi:hypothetical protein